MQDQQANADDAPVAAVPAQQAVEPSPPAVPDAAAPAAVESVGSVESVESASAVDPLAPGAASRAQSLRAEAKALLDRLRAENRVFRERLPMALGMHRQLAGALGVTGLVARRVCAVHSGSLPYLRHLAAGGARYDLEGNPAGEVTPEQVETARRQAAELLARRAQQAGAGGQRVKPAASAGPAVATQPTPAPRRNERQRPAQDGRRMERFARKAAPATGRPPQRSPRAAGAASGAATSHETSPAVDAPSSVDVARATATPAAAGAGTVAAPRRTEPRRDAKADPQARNASALAMALSAAMQSAPAEFAPRPAAASGETVVPKERSRDRRGRNADRR